MKHLILSFLVTLCISINSHAQFSTPIFIDSFQTSSIFQLTCSDVTNDNKVDIVISHFQYPYENLILYTNTGNNLFSSSPINSASNIQNIQGLEISDLNADGFNDLVTVSGLGKNTLLYWYDNSNGLFTPHFIDTLAEASSGLILNDFNKDGKIDILVKEHIEITIRYQDSLGNFGPKQIIHSGTEFYAIDVADYNNDGYTDVSVASGGFDILLNNKNNGFNLFSHGGQSLSFGLKSADLDNDQDVDIAVYESLKGIRFYKNDGVGNFVFQDTILHSVDNFLNYSLLDLDCDNDIDLYTSIPQINKIVWCENVGLGNFKQPKTLYTQTGQLVKETTVADINADGKADLLWGNKHLGVILNTCLSNEISTIDKDVDISVYPNPFGNHFSVKNNTTKEIEIKVIDALGRELNTILIEKESTKKVVINEPGFVYLLYRYNKNVSYKQIKLISLNR